MRKTTITLLVFLVVCVGLAWVAFQPAPGRPNVSISLLGYTNEPSGARLAVIAVSNLNAITVYVYHGCIRLQSSAESSDWIQWHSTLGGGASDIFTVPPPTNQSPWRLSFYVYNDIGFGQVLKRTIFMTARRHPYDIDSDWFDVKR